MLPLSRFEVLRVLDLEGCNLEESEHLNLSSVGDLLHLRYLGLRDTKVRKIPMEIGKLLFLQTLDLEGEDEDAKELPSSVVQLRSLMYLYISQGTYMPVGYRNLTSLEQLNRPHFTEDGNPEDLRYLTELRLLEFCLPSKYPPGKLLILLDSLGILLDSLGKLHKLQILCIVSDGYEIDNFCDWVPSSPELRVLELEGWYEKMPTRLSSSSLPLLTDLDILVHQVRPEDIQVLGTLPALRTFRLRSDVDTSTEEERAKESPFVLSPDAFPRAEECMLGNVLFAPYMFTRGAMPKVWALWFGLLVSDILGDDEWELCLRNLPSLRSVWIKLYGEEASSKRYSEAEAAVERSAVDHPNRPKAYTQ
jgi:hypothetical protein